MTALAPLPQGPLRRLVYFGTPAMAVPPLEALVAAGFEIAMVITRPDKRRGRGSELSPSAVKAAAVRLGLPVSHDLADAVDVGAELGVVVAFGQLIRPPVLERLAMVNLHFSLLPRWRGAAPVERAILEGDAVTGVCLMRLDIGLDTGDVLDRVEVPIGPRQTAEELRRNLVDVGSVLLVENLRRGLGVGVPQSGEPTYAAKLAQADLEIDWHRPAEEVDRLVRLGQAFTTFRGKRLKVLAATVVHRTGVAGTFIDPLTIACWQEAVELDRVQPEGKPVMAAAAWANGARPLLGEAIGSPMVSS